MYRVYEKLIRDWINNSNKALLIYGARQVGKTYLIREILKQNNITFCEYNLIERNDILGFLSNANSASDISEKLALYSDVPLTEGESVIFLDEIQLYPDIVTKIKFLVDEGKYRYVLSGSNLGVELKGIRSVPVGYLESHQMFPMNF
ncbi:MAG: AAA family ATPase, partial [Lachnospiraceae bacterium]|nr:AAA family ATPase [Lachnospiraceae bacterium]